MKHCHWLLLLASLSAAASEPAIEPWTLPTADAHAAQPNLQVDGDAVLLSWIEPADGGHRLRFARSASGIFGPARDIARGAHWFVNWADFPALQPLADGRMAAFVLVRNGDAPYAYDVRLAWSGNAGESWSPLAAVHDDGTPTEHGFAALWRWQDELGIAWLDGRNTAGAAADGDHGHAGMMSLRAARLSADGAKRGEWALDDSVCDCCQTAAAVTDDGPVLVYRNRADGEIRDIGILRWTGDGWSEARTVHADGWFMPACPVNGPAVVADGRELHVAWYTAAGGEPQLKVARSADAGASFESPAVIDTGADMLGRIAMARSGDGLWLAWLREIPDTGRQALMLRRLDPATLQGEPARQVADIGGGRASGFPRMAVAGGWLHLAWTDVVERRPQLRGARMPLRQE